MIYLQWVGSEVVVGGVLVITSVIQYLITVNGPFTCNPLVELFIEDWLFRKLIGNIMLCRNLECSLLRVDCVFDKPVI